MLNRCQGDGAGSLGSGSVWAGGRAAEWAYSEGFP